MGGCVDMNNLCQGTAFSRGGHEVAKRECKMPHLGQKHVGEHRRTGGKVL